MAYPGLPYGQFRDGGSSVPRYTYRPLPPDSIRLLRIRGDHEQAEIQCDLDIESLDNPPRYTALSYAWEDPPIFNTQPPALAQYILPNPYNYSSEANQRIYITGKVLPVGKNLYAALRYLRSSGSRTVWTDAICLDQESDAEKVKQIRQMGKIYSQASKVVIWLGPAYLNSDLAIEMVRNLAEVVHRAEFRQMFRLSVEQEAPLAVQWTLAIYALLHRAYWGRSWIVQEVALARGGVQVTCGTKTIDWETMTEFLSFLQLEGDAISRLLYKAGHGLGYYGQNLPPNFKWNDYAMRLSKACKRIHDYGRTNLLDILAKTRHTRAGKEVDLIYSKLGLSTDGEFLVPEISYETPIQELCVELVQNSILYSDSLDILSHSALQHPSWKPRFPSWMPDWQALEIHDPLIEVLPNRPMTGHIFQAAGDSTPQVIVRNSRYNNRGESLMLHSFFKAEGFVIDIVDGLGANFTRIYSISATTAPQGQTQTQNFLPPWIHLINDELSDKTGSQTADVPLIQPWYNTATNNRYASAQAILSAIWRSIVANQDDLDRPSNGASPVHAEP
jgi:hypothetical protein